MYLGQDIHFKDPFNEWARRQAKTLYGAPPWASSFLTLVVSLLVPKVRSTLRWLILGAIVNRPSEFVADDREFRNR